MQDWFYVQSATYGSYYISVEINGYDVYKVTLSYYNPENNLVNYPTDETTTGNKIYARKRYKQLMKRAEEDLYGWNYGIENPTWEFNQSDWGSIKEYIFSSSMPGKSNYQFQWVEDDYTGGNIIVVYGQLANGNYFSASDANYDAYILDSDPRVEHNGELDGAVVGDDYGWLEEHSVVELSEDEQIKFWIALLNYCKKNNIKLYTYADYDAAIKELKSLL